MKRTIFALIGMMSMNALAAVETAYVRVPVGVRPNPQLAPMGQLVNIKTGEVLYVVSVISVATPSQLRDDCIYTISYTRGPKIKSQVQLVPPMSEVSCGHEFPISR
jgi:hypothetical protein